MPVFDSTQYIWLKPLCHNRETIQRLLDLAIPIQDKDIRSLDPIYIMNVLDDSSTYRTLILTHTGNVFVSKRSSHWVAETIFEQMGFRYETWCSFWQATGIMPLQSLPYVNGHSVFLKVSRGGKLVDWLNVSHCVSMDLWTTLRHNEVEAPALNFYFQLKQADHICLGVQLVHQGTLLSRQLALAIQLREAWQCYYMALVSKRLPRWVVNTQDEWQDRFAMLTAGTKKEQSIDPDWLESFQLYLAICRYIEYAPSERQLLVSQLLAKKCLDRQTLRKLLDWYRRNGDLEEPHDG